MSGAIPLNAKAINAARDPANYVPEFTIETVDEEVRPMAPLGYGQQVTLDHLVLHPWLKVRKYRQAWITTLAVAWLEGQVQYNEGVRGVLIAEKTSTAQEAFRRLSLGYQHQPRAITIPCELAPRMGTQEFPHGGGIKIITAGSDAPAIGNSPDRIVLTEYEEFPDQDLFNQHFFPAINRRRKARVLDESTPGDHGSTGHAMWLKALEGKSRFHPLFLEWWRDPTCVEHDDGFALDVEETRLMDLMPGITREHLAFRRKGLDTEFVAMGEQGFRHKYPYHKRDGWFTKTAPAVPVDAIEPYYHEDNIRSAPEYEDFWLDEYEEGAPYLITADPAGFGRVGDPSALTAWHGWDKREVVSWSGREDPDRFADRLLRLQAQLGGPYSWTTRKGCLIAVEANKGECCAALVAKGAEGLYWTDDTPGWISTETKKADGMFALVDMLRRRELKLFSEPTIHQLGSWDGKTRTRAKSKEGTHHFDRAITCLIAAFLFRIEPMGTRPRPRREPEEPGKRRYNYSAKEFLTFYDTQRQKEEGPNGVLGVYGRTDVVSRRLRRWRE